MYRYRGADLQVSSFRDVLKIVGAGREISKTDAVREVLEYHESNGGIVSKKDYFAMCKKAIQKRQDSDGIEVIYHGMYRIAPIARDDFCISAYNMEPKCIGSGLEHVYVYFYDAYRKLASYEGKDIFPCKVGMSRADSIIRIKGQSGTNMPESPVLGLDISCDNAKKLEALLHKHLIEKGRHMDAFPGKEWFLTSPDEVEHMYCKIKEM